MSLPLPYGVGVVDPQCPIDWSHPLNRGLVYDSTITPNSGWRGGPTLCDLVRGGRVPHDGTLTASPTWVSSFGRVGGYGSIQYANASSQYVTASTPVTGPPYTFCAWARLTSAPGGDLTIISLGVPGTTDSWCRLVYRESGTFWRVNHGDSSGTQTSIDSSVTVTQNKWAFVSATLTSGLILTLYVQGVSMGSSSVAASNAYTNLSLGVLRFSSDIQFWQGQIDSPLVFNRVLSSAEILQLYQETAAGNPNRWRWLLKGAWFSATATSPPPAGRLSRPASLEGLGGAGQQCFNPSLAGV